MFRRHRNFRITAVVLMAFMAISCASIKGSIGYRQGKRAYETKQFVESMEKFMESLDKNPEREDTLALFPQAFNEGTAYYLDNINAGLGSADTGKLDNAVSAAKNLQQMHTLIGKAGRTEVKTEDFSELVAKVLAEAADAHYMAGKKALEGGTPRSGRNALNHFTQAENYGAHSAVHLKAQAKELATVKVLMMTEPNKYFDSSVFSETMVYFMNQLYKKNNFISFEAGDSSGKMSVQDAADNAAAEIGILFKPFSDFSSDRREQVKSFPATGTAVTDVKIITYSYTKHASADWTISYNWKGQGPRKSIEGSSGKYSDSDQFLINIIQSDGMKELKLGDSKRQNMRYLESKTSDENAINEALYLGSKDYNNIVTPSEISDEFDQTQWHDYFMNQYDDFSYFKESYSGKTCFYGVELIKAGEGYYYINGKDSLDAKNSARRSSAIMNGLAYTAKDLIQKEGENWGGAWLIFEKAIQKDIDSLLNQ